MPGLPLPLAGGSAFNIVNVSATTQTAASTGPASTSATRAATTTDTTSYQNAPTVVRGTSTITVAAASRKPSSVKQAATTVGAASYAGRLRTVVALAATTVAALAARITSLFRVGQSVAAASLKRLVERAFDAVSLLIAPWGIAAEVFVACGDLAATVVTMSPQSRVNVYTSGEVVRVRAGFTSRPLTDWELGQLIANNQLPAGIGEQPPTVNAEVLRPDGSVLENLVATNAGNGIYYLDVDTTGFIGNWSVRLYSPQGQSFQGAGETTFKTTSAFVTA